MWRGCLLCMCRTRPPSFPPLPPLGSPATLANYVPLGTPLRKTFASARMSLNDFAVQTKVSHPMKTYSYTCPILFMLVNGSDVTDSPFSSFPYIQAINTLSQGCSCFPN